MEDILKALKELYLTKIKGPSQPDRDQLVRDCRKADMYYRGIQYLQSYTLKSGQQGVVPVAMFSDMVQQAFGQDDLPDVADYVVNFYKGDIDKFVAVALKQQVAHKAAPVIDSYKTEASDKLRIADAVSGYLDSIWGINGIREKVLYTLAKYGPAFLYTPYITDGKLGTTKITIHSHEEIETNGKWRCVECGEEVEQGSEGQGEEGELVCPGCGAPLEDESLIPGGMSLELKEEEVETTNGTTGCHVTNWLTVNVPKFCTGPEDAQWWVYEYEAPMGHVNRLLAQAQRKTVTTTAPNDLPSFVRNRVATTSGLVYSNLPTDVVTVRRVWFTPGMFWELAASQKDLVTKLETMFPRGCMLLMINDEPFAVEEGAISDCWKAIIPQKSDYLMTADPVFKCYFEASDIVNSIINMIEGIIATSAPVTAYRADMLEPRVVNDVIGRGYRSMIPMKGDARGAFADLPVSQPSGVAQAFVQFVIGTYREIVGISPNMWGMGNYNTAKEAVLAAEQALQVFHPIFEKIAQGLADAKYNAALLLAEFSGGYLPMLDGRTKPLELQGIEGLLEGGWKYDFDPTLAISTAARRDTLRELMNNQGVSQYLGLQHPLNVKSAHEMFGLNGMYVPGEDELKFVQSLIDKVLEGEMVELPPTNLVNPQFAVEVIKATLISEKGRQIKDTDPGAWQMGVQFLESMLGMMGQGQQQGPPDGGGPPPEQMGPPPDGGAPMEEMPPEGEGGAPPLIEGGEGMGPEEGVDMEGMPQ
jgi:hypothetical protein